MSTKQTKDKKPAYRKPVLVEFGAVKTLTQQGTGGQADATMPMADMDM